MDTLWAPWRESYVTKASKKERPHKCVFCRINGERRLDAANFVFLRSKLTFSVLNIYPFNSAHSLVVPCRHVDDLDAMTKEERSDLMDMILRTKALMTKAFKPHAFNVGVNLGRIAGAGIPEHLHVHIVPRWSGDVNFMPAVFNTKVIPVSLKSAYRALIHANKS